MNKVVEDAILDDNIENTMARFYLTCKHSSDIQGHDLSKITDLEEAKKFCEEQIKNNKQ